MTLQDIYKLIEAFKGYIPFVNFIVGLVSFFLLWHIKKVFSFNSNIDNHRNKIREMQDELLSLLNDYKKNFHEIDEKLILIDVELRAMIRGASGNLLSDVKKSRSLIRGYQFTLWIIKSERNKSEAAVREIRKSLLSIPAEIEHVKRNLTIGGK